MGLKTGFIAMALSRGLYIKIKNTGDKCSSFAKVFAIEDSGKIKMCLKFLDGTLGHLKMGHSSQWNIFIEFRDWVPTREEAMILQGKATLPKEMIMFGGDYVVREVPESELLPPAEHTTDESRFQNPVGLWNIVVARHLNLVRESRLKRMQVLS